MGSTPEASKKNFPERDARFTTLSDMDVPLLSTPADLKTEGFDYLRDLGFPGEYPLHPRRSAQHVPRKTWTMRQFAGFASAEETNKRFKLLLEHGQTGLSTAFDMPTLMGYDADSPRGKRRGRKMRRFRLLSRRHGTALRRNSSR